jgi:hypothetical protein
MRCPSFRPTDPASLINVFTVAPERQGVLIAHLQDATEQIPAGLASANIRASLDGTRVVNYVQWQTPPRLRSHAGELANKPTWPPP